jgi:hypothetical protein
MLLSAVGGSSCRRRRTLSNAQLPLSTFGFVWWAGGAREVQDPDMRGAARIHPQEMPKADARRRGNSTAQHSTAQHSTAQHSTARHSMTWQLHTETAWARTSEGYVATVPLSRWWRLTRVRACVRACVRVQRVPVDDPKEMEELQDLATSGACVRDQPHCILDS